jgi:hypothetical protein
MDTSTLAQFTSCGHSQIVGPNYLAFNSEQTSFVNPFRTNPHLIADRDGIGALMINRDTGYWSRRYIQDLYLQV